MASKPVHKLKIQIYKAKDGWRWRWTRNKKIVGDSGEGYTRKASCIKTCAAIIAAIAGFNYVWDLPGTKLQ